MATRGVKGWTGGAELIDVEDESTDVRNDALPLVEAITVRDLYGRADYDLDLRTRDEFGNMSLIYGDNGTGKTTILRLLWDLLSPAPNRHHRTRISKIAFRRFSIFLADSTEIRALRKVPSAGPYTIEVRRNNRLQSRSTWPDKGPYDDFIASLSSSESVDRFETDPDLKSAVEQAKAKKIYLDRLQGFGPPYFLADTRTTSSDEVEEDARYTPRARQFEIAQHDSDESRAFSNPLAFELDSAIRQVSAKLRRLSLGASVSGSAGANSVYLDVIQQLASFSALDVDAASIRKQLTNKIEAVGDRSVGYEALDLVPRFSTRDFVRSIRAVEEENLANVRAIVEPFLQSSTARLDALEPARSLIQTLLDETNQYLIDKRLTYRHRTLRIELLEGAQLKTDQLSSGECHILLLLLNAVLARGSARLFIIDEPELSLNVKWQRRIVQSLLSLTAGSGLQFVLATHSIELLSGFRDRVVHLAPRLA